MLPKEEIDNQRKLLAIYRQTLAHYLQQQAIHGTAHVPPAVVGGITEARDNIRRIKALLQSWGVMVEDYPSDVEPDFADIKDESATKRPPQITDLSSSNKSSIALENEAPLRAPVLSRDNSFIYDVFISYRQQEPDRTWVRQILVPRLEATGLRVCVDYRDFKLGALLLREIEYAVEQSRYTLAIATPAYLMSNFAELENVLAEHSGLETRHRRLLVAMRAECRPRLGMRARLWLDMTNDAELENNLVSLVSEIRRPLDD